MSAGSAAAAAAGRCWPSPAGLLVDRLGERRLLAGLTGIAAGLFAFVPSRETAWASGPS